MGERFGLTGRERTGFDRLLAATWSSNLGDGVRLAALPLLAASIDPSPRSVTYVAAASTVPFAVLGLPAGTFADRQRRVPLIALANLFRFAVMAVLAAAVLTDRTSIELLVSIAFALGCGEAVADSATPALLPDLVEPDDLLRANARLSTAEVTGNDLAGPALGGILTAAAPAAPFLFDAASFLSSGALVGSIRVDEPHAEASVRRRWSTDLIEGLRLSLQDQVLRSTGALTVLLQFGNVAAIAPMVVYLTTVLDLDATGYGIFLSVGALGGVIGARTTPGSTERLGDFATLVAGSAAIAVGFTTMTVHQPAVAAAGYAMSWWGLVTGRIVIVSARQRAVPGALLGRAQGAIRSALWASASVGALVGGALAESVGSEAPFLFSAGISLVAVALLGLPVRRALAAPTAHVNGVAPRSR